MSPRKLLRFYDGNGRLIHECPDCHYLICPVCRGHAMVIGGGVSHQRYECQSCRDRFNVRLTPRQRHELHMRRHGGAA